MGQIVSAAAKPKRCNLNQLSQVPTPAAGEYILVSSNNSMNAAGQGYFDCYIKGDGHTAATSLELHWFKGEELDRLLHPYSSVITSSFETGGTDINTGELISNAKLVRTSLINAEDCDTISVTITSSKTISLSHLVKYLNGVFVGNTDITTNTVVEKDDSFNQFRLRCYATSNFSTSEISATSASISYNKTEDLIGDIRNNTEAIAEIEPLLYTESTSEIDISSLTELDGFPAISTWAINLTEGERTHISIPVSEGEIYQITCNATNGSFYYLLTSNDIPTKNNETPSFVSGFTSRVAGSAAQVLEVTIPNGCNYLAISKTYSSTNDYLPSAVSKVDAMGETLKNIVLSDHQYLETIQTIVGEAVDIDTEGVAINGVVGTTGLWESGYAVLIPCSPNYVYTVKGTYIIWMKSNDEISVGSIAPVSNYAKWQVLLSHDEAEEIVSPPDANYMLCVGVTRLVKNRAYEPRPLATFSDKLAYLVNLSARWIFNEYVRGWSDPTSTGASETAVRTPVGFARGLALLLVSGKYDAGEVYNTKTAIKTQAHRLSMWMVNCHNAVGVNGTTWGGSWQSPLWAAWAATPAAVMPELFTETELGYIRTMLIYESDIIIQMSSDNDLYWSTTSSHSGDTKADSMSWNCECLAVTIDMCPNAINYDEYKRKLVEFTIIAQSMPSDSSLDVNINGYNLTNLHGYNYLDDGTTFNHSILHPDYMMSWAIDSCVSLVCNKKAIPRALNHNVKQILHALTDIEFEGGSTLNSRTLRYPTRSIYQEGNPMIHYPMGNDWATKPRAFRQFIIGGVRGWTFSVDNDADWSRMANILINYTIGMKNRFTNGATYESSDECDYRAATQGMAIPESNFIEQIACALIYTTFAVDITDESWYTYTISGNVSGVTSGTLVFTPLFGDEVTYEATISSGAYSIDLGGGQYSMSISGYTLDTTSVNVQADATIDITAS